MSSSFQSTGIVQTEKGLSYLSEDSKSILENFHGWVSTKYGLENVNFIITNAETNGIYDTNYNLLDFNLTISTFFDSSNSRRFNESDIDIENDTITISDQIFSVGEKVSFIKEGSGNLPNGIIKDEKLYVKSVTAEGEKYKFTFSKQKDGDKFDFTDQGSGGDTLLAIRNPSITNFDTNDIDLVNNTITISNLSTLEVGDRISFQTSGGTLPTGNLITPDADGYSTAALDSSNLFTDFGTLSTTNNTSITNMISSFSDAEMLAPYASISTTGETFFSFADANSDGLTHFRSFGSGVIGLEDLKGGGDQDFDDLILGFDFQLASV